MRDPDRLLNPYGRRHFRRRYSLPEVRVGAAVAAGLMLIAGWVAYRGAHPDPELFGEDPRFLPAGETAAWPARARAQARVPASADSHWLESIEGPPLVARDWEVSSVSSFGPDNLFEKINGREGFYKGFGFRELRAAALRAEDAALTIDIEWFDLGTLADALGAFHAERPEDASVEVRRGGLRYLHRNLLALARGEHYIRLIGSDESPPLQSSLKSLAERFEGALEGARLPWSYTLFGGVMQIPVNRLSFEKKNAFSFAFADRVHVAQAGEDLEVFVSLRSSPEEARTQVRLFRNGFLSLGKPAGPFIEDRYLGTYSGVQAHRDMVLGVRGAESPGEARAQLTLLREAVRQLSDVDLRAAREERRNSEAAPSGDDPSEAREETH